MALISSSTSQCALMRRRNSAHWPLHSLRWPVPVPVPPGHCWPLNEHQQQPNFNVLSVARLAGKCARPQLNSAQVGAVADRTQKKLSIEQKVQKVPLSAQCRYLLHQTKYYHHSGRHCCLQQHTFFSASLLIGNKVSTTTVLLPLLRC